MTSAAWPPEPTTKLPIQLKPYVELFCTLPKESLLIPLSINLILVLLCTFFGFKTRKLPENFNESKCIFLCVCSTLFLFTAFLPTYFAAFYAYHKSVLLSLYKARHAHKRLYTVLPKYSKIQVLPGITSCRLVKDNKQAIELNS